jgi:hypothetical protein
MNDSRMAVGNLKTETSAAQALSVALKAMPGMDDETIRDMIEGNTGLHEQLVWVVGLLTETEVMLEGLDAKITEFEARKKRYKDRKDYLRAAIEQAMVVGELKKKEMPDCTLVLANRAASVRVVDESVIPPLYWKAADPTLDRKTLLDDLKGGAKIAGVELSNGGVSLTVKRS